MLKGITYIFERILGQIRFENAHLNEGKQVYSAYGLSKPLFNKPESFVYLQGRL